MGKRGPTSLETKQKQLTEFVADILLSGVLEHLKAQSAKKAKSNQEEPKDVFRRHPAFHMKERYGIHCYDLFRLCFIQHLRGGRSEKGIGYPSIWKFNPETVTHLSYLNLMRTSRKGFLTAKEWVEYLLHNGITPKTNTVILDETATKVEKRVLTEEESKLVRKENRRLRELANKLQIQDSAEPFQTATDYLDISSTY